MGRIVMTASRHQNANVRAGRFKLHASAIALLAIPGAAFAQDAPAATPPPAQAGTPDATPRSAPDQGGIQEIVVTARKRSENLQRVPIAITAFTPEALALKGITDVAGLGKFAPGVDIVSTSPFSGSNQVLSAFIRGIGQNDFAFNLDPGVGVYVDGVYYARTVGAVVDLLDLDHVEILKGPQGTLFGRNTIGGAISVVTRDPGNTFSGAGDATYGSFNRVDVRGTVDIPIVDDILLSQVSFSEKHADGYFHFLKFPGVYVNDADEFVRPDNTTYDSAGGYNDQNLRVKLKWKITPDVTFRLTGDFTNDDDQSTGSQLLALKPGLKDVYNSCITTPVAVLAAGPLNAICNTPRGLPAATVPGFTNNVLPPLGGVNVDADPTNNHLVFDERFFSPRIDTSYGTGAGYSKIKTFGFSGTLDAQLTDTLAIKSISAYRNLDSRFALDVDGSPIAMGDHAFTMHQQQESEEVQLLGNFFEDRLKTVTGVYYFHEDGDLTDFVHFAGGLLQIDGPNKFDTSSYAAFTQADYKITDRLGITGGVRYTRDEKEFQGGQRDLNSLAYKLGYPLALHPDPNDPTLYFPTTDNHLKFSNVSFKAGVNYQATDSILTYATFSQGYKAGGWTTRATTPILTAPTFDPEKADTYEVGLKSQFFDRMLQANLAAYYTKYKDLQVTVYSGISPVTINAAQSEIKGLEAEFVLVPTKALTLAATFGYIDARYTEKDPGTNLGTMFVNTPKYAVSVNADYVVPLPSGAAINGHIDYSYKSSIARDAENTPELISPQTNVFGALISYHSPTNEYHVDVGVTNLTDERFIVSGQDQSGIGYVAGTYNRPREFYVRAGFKF
ncbi:TonB-dependent receptor [Sphingomonas koreensis]|nr:TonB-dependent receptor [Sphingomonas koreensis]